VAEDGRDRASKGAGGAPGRTTLHSALARSSDDPPGGNRDRVEERSCSRCRVIPPAVDTGYRLVSIWHAWLAAVEA